ncbi:MAG: hypothetical protein R3B13_21850 [Polyangiaceae bacterium]
MRVTAAIGTALLLGALLACKSSSSSSGPAASASAASDEAVDDSPVGSFGKITDAEVEARAKAAGFKILKTESDTDGGGVSLLALELEDAKHYAYVNLYDLAPPRTNKGLHAAKMGSTGGIAIELDDEYHKPDADKLLSDLVAKQPVDGATRAKLKAALESLGWDVESASSETEDGLTVNSVTGTNDDGGISVTHIDLSAALKDKRAAIDGTKLMNVFVCKDCTKRKVNAFSEAWQRAKAGRLLRKIAKSD